MLRSISRPVVAGAAIGVLAALVGLAPARAVPINVTYSINLTFFAPAANTIAIQGPASLTVQFANGTAAGHVSAGSLHVVGGTAMLTNNFTPPAGGGLINFTGFQNIIFPGSGMGTVSAGGLFNFGTVGHIASGMIHCFGLCGLAPPFVASVPVNLTSGPRSININGPLLGFPSMGPQSFNAGGTGGMTPNGAIYVVTATGQEVDRVVVPEPGTGLLLGVGLAGFGIALTTWRARRRRA